MTNEDGPSSARVNPRRVAVDVRPREPARATGPLFAGAFAAEQRADEHVLRGRVAQRLLDQRVRLVGPAPERLGERPELVGAVRVESAVEADAERDESFEPVEEALEVFAGGLLVGHPGSRRYSLRKPWPQNGQVRS